jgi:hypothetical protein
VQAPAITCYSCTAPGSPDPIVVRFSQSAAPLQLNGKDIPEQLEKWINLTS